MTDKSSKNWLDKLSANQSRMAMNWWPPLLGAGIKIKTISPDFRYVEAILKLTFYNRNYVGTQFGGSIVSLTDPFYMLMLLKNLGRDYIVWDKMTTVDFKKPGRSDLKAIFELKQDEIDEIKKQANENGKYLVERVINVLNTDGEIVAVVTKTLYVRRKT